MNGLLYAYCVERLRSVELHEAVALLPDTVGKQNVPMEVELEVRRKTLGYADGAHEAMADRPGDLAIFRLERWDDGKLMVFRIGPEDREAAFAYQSEVR